MYKASINNEDQFNMLMAAIKDENELIKGLKASKKYKIGELIVDVVCSFGSIRSLNNQIRKIAGKIRWKRLCRKYPISHSKDSDSKPVNYFTTEEIVVYTSIFGNYDLPQEPVFRPDNCRFVIFTDQKIAQCSAWEKFDLPQEVLTEQLTNAEKNRYCKMLPHTLFPNNRYSIYIDGNIKPISDLTEFLNLCSDRGMALHMHKSRECVYDEIEACRILKKADKQALEKFRDFLEEHGFPHHYGMNECNVIVRDHSNSTVSEIMNEWWRMFREGSVKRDQLSFPYLLYKYGITPKEIGTLGNNVQENPAIRVTLHN